MDWDDVRHFLALARTGSVRAAGSSLGVSHSTVARRVEALEARLDARLFDRNRDGYSLTESGRAMLPGAQRVEQELADIERDLAGGDARMAGLVSLTCCDAWVSAMLMPRLAALSDAHPDLQISVFNDPRPFDLSKREADVALRVLAVGDRPPEHLIGRPLVPITVCSYVALEHAQRLAPGGPGARWLAFDDAKITELLISSSSHPGVPPWGSFSSIDSLAQAAYAGLGWVMLPTYIGDRDGRLTRLAIPDLRHVADLWLLCHPDLRDNARVRAARRCAEEALLAHAGWFRGECPAHATLGCEHEPSRQAPEPLS